METGLQTLNQQQKLTIWSQRISTSRSSGRTVSTWCAENGISTASYYKRQKRLFQMAVESKPKLVEVSARTRTSAVAVLHINGAEVELSAGIDEETLRTICRCLQSC